MKPAAEKFQSVLNEITIHDTNIPVIANVTAEVITRGADIQEKLMHQLLQEHYIHLNYDQRQSQV